MGEIKNNKAFYNTEIPVDWEVKKLGECCLVKGEYGINAPAVEFSEDLPAYLRITDIDDNGNYSIDKKASVGDPNFEQFILKNGDIVFARTGATVGKTYLYKPADGTLVFAGFLIRFRTNNNILTSHYLKYFTETKPYWDWVKTVSMRSGQPGINAEEYSSLKIPLPPLPEQKAIARVLSTADATIHTTEKLIAQKELRKKWLKQQLLTGKKRLKGFVGEVKLKVVEHFLKEVSERNKDLKITNVLSVTNSRGFINQAEQFDRVVASEDATNYKIVRKGQFAYNPSRVNVGSLDLLRDFESGILSPMYVVFETDKSQLLPEYFYYQLKTQWFYGHIPMFVQGSVRDSLSFDGLCSMKFFIPSIQEQTAIAQVLQAADTEISLLKAKAEKLREQKKGLMQVLLTGKVRLKINF